MNKLLFFFYVLAVLVTILVFYVMNYFTAPITPSEGGGGGGNPPIIILVFTLPFIMFFVYGTIELFMRFTLKRLSKKVTIISIILSLLLAGAIVVLTIIKADALRNRIVDVKENFNDPSVFPLLNTFSNDIFFNPLTFLMVLLLCYVFGAIWGINRKKKNPKSKEQKLVRQINFVNKPQ
ncbi:hypothetical protein [Planomicrobium okeanokoites]|uniref:Uncharacterized protein n=1 Tax=Planomicrobium okeanokoites TaxID=244 RepID=A0ABV7KMP9_PLAOK|nr:hypothetical protein [Planomicrobium okeanokoites]TAA65653.1 hypothetical protein D2910_16420 [Planomicrobium okeanokoites]